VRWGGGDSSPARRGTARGHWPSERKCARRYPAARGARTIAWVARLGAAGARRCRTQPESPLTGASRNARTAGRLARLALPIERALAGPDVRHVPHTTLAMAQ